MTVMIGRFFGMPQELIRSGIWKELKPGEKDLYVCLLHRSERHRTRTMTVPDAEVRKEVGTATRTCCDARKKLQERGLITYKREEGGAYTYELCDPNTREPYPGPANLPVIPPNQGNISKQTTSNAPVACNERPPQSSQRNLPSSPSWEEIGKCKSS